MVPSITVTEAKRTVTVSPVTSVVMRGHVEVTNCHAELVRNHSVLVMIETVMWRGGEAPSSGGWICV